MAGARSGRRPKTIIVSSDSDDDAPVREKKVTPEKKAAPLKKAAAEKKAAHLKKAAAEKKAVPVKKAAAEKKAAPEKKTTPKKRAAQNSADMTPRKKAATGGAKLTAEDFIPSEVNLNERLTEPLLALAKEEMDLGNKFKGISIKNAAIMLKKYPMEILSGNDALKLKGIGKSIAKKIDDILASGAIHKSEHADADHENLESIGALSKVHGISRAFASTLVREHNVKSVVDLIGKQELLDQPAKIGLKYFKDFQEHISAKEVEAILDGIKQEAEKIGAMEIREYGQYAHQEEPIDEIHVLVGTNDKSQFNALLDRLIQSGVIVDTISSSNTAVKAVCIMPVKPDAKQQADTPAVVAPKKTFSIPKFSELRKATAQAPDLFTHREAASFGADRGSISTGSDAEQSRCIHRRIEFRHCTMASFHTYYTFLLGPAFFQQLRDAANSKGYVLTEKILREQTDENNPGKHINVDSEQRLFDILGMEFVPYDLRSSFEILK